MNPLLFFSLLVSGWRMAEKVAASMSEENSDLAPARIVGVHLAQPADPVALANYTFDVYFNVIAKDDTYEGGWVSKERVLDQLDMMNEAYDGTGISWNLLEVIHVVNEKWFDPKFVRGRPNGTEMFKALRKGGATTLNVYTVGFTDMDVTGFSSSPEDYAAKPHEDGCMVQFDTLPGGTSPDRQGGTLIHETGHWLGLRHTFSEPQGYCDDNDDGIDDTPPQIQQTSGCPQEPEYSCNSTEPHDIHNWMDYSSDKCRRHFTPGQLAVMRETIKKYRSNREV